MQPGMIILIKKLLYKYNLELAYTYFEMSSLVKKEYRAHTMQLLNGQRCLKTYEQVLQHQNDPASNSILCFCEFVINAPDLDGRALLVKLEQHASWSQCAFEKIHVYKRV